MKKKVMLGVALLMATSSALAIECIRPIERIFTGYTVSESKIHVEHGDGYAASAVRLSSVNNDEKIVDRILSVLLAAHMGGREVKFRYPGTTASCTPTTNQLVEAVWIH